MSNTQLTHTNTNMTSKALNIAKHGLKVVNLGPTVTHALASQVVDAKYATAAYVAATALDYIVPCFPMGSVLGITGFGIANILKHVNKSDEQHTEVKIVEAIR